MRPGLGRKLSLLLSVGLLRIADHPVLGLDQRHAALIDQVGEIAGALAEARPGFYRPRPAITPKARKRKPAGKKTATRKEGRSPLPDQCFAAFSIRVTNCRLYQDSRAGPSRPLSGAHPRN